MGRSILLLAGIALIASHRSPDPPQVLPDLALECEQAVAVAELTEVREIDLLLQPGLPFGNELPNPLGRVLGVAWTPDTDALHVLDGTDGVVVYDTLGNMLASYGGIGEGPGEFQGQRGDHGGGGGQYNQVASLDDGYVLVHDLGPLHLFTADGEFVNRVGTSAEIEGPFAVRHLAGIGDRRAITAVTGGVRQLDSPYKTGRQTLGVANAGPDGLALQPIAFVRNRFSDRSYTSFSPRSPYDGWTRRLWDARPALLATLPSESAGICLFDPDDLELDTAIQLAVPNIRVDGAERRRVIRELQDRFPRPPVAGGTWEDFYPFWPEHLPIGLDVVAAPGNAVWVERATGPSTRVVDIYDDELGYRGTAALPFDRLPIGFDDRCAYVVTSEPAGESVSELPFYGLQRWCPRSGPSRVGPPVPAQHRSAIRGLASLRAAPADPSPGPPSVHVSSGTAPSRFHPRRHRPRHS